jgi:hypothetical protein
MARQADHAPPFDRTCMKPLTIRALELDRQGRDGARTFRSAPHPAFGPGAASRVRAIAGIIVASREAWLPLGRHWLRSLDDRAFSATAKSQNHGNQSVSCGLL